jgi:hypothetical protein
LARQVTALQNAAFENLVFLLAEDDNRAFRSGRRGGWSALPA